MIQSLQTIINAKQLTQTDKNSCHSYGDHFYDHAFAPYREKEIRLVEIGTFIGHSLILWSEYFPHASIIGVDLQTPSFLSETYPRMSFIQGDAYSPPTTAIVPSCDILIDDGSHNLMHQLWVLQQYSSKVRSGGLLVIEDVAHPAYFHALKAATPAHLQPHIEWVDLRSIKNRFDDLLFVVRVP